MALRTARRMEMATVVVVLARPVSHETSQHLDESRVSAEFVEDV